MSRFTMTLPSNSSMNYYEYNTAAQFTTKLAQTIELDGDWEVGLSSIGVPAEVENVIAKECYCNTYYDDVLKWIVTLPPDDYYRTLHVIDALRSEQRRKLGQNEMQIIQLTHINSRKHVMVCTHSSIMRRVKFEFSLDLARMCRIARTNPFGNCTVIQVLCCNLLLGNHDGMVGSQPIVACYTFCIGFRMFVQYCRVLEMTNCVGERWE